MVTDAVPENAGVNVLTFALAGLNPVGVPTVYVVNGIRAVQSEY
jgi:hypothetical protein